MDLPGYDAWKTREPDWDQRREDACPRCGGTGLMWLSPCNYPCDDCGGSGEFDPEGEPIDGDEDEFFGAGIEEIEGKGDFDERRRDRE